MDFKRFVRAEWDRIAGYACLAAGAVALVVGFLGVRQAADVIDEISYLVSGGVGAMFLLGVGATLLLSADLHDDFRKLHRVEEKLDAIHRALTAGHPDLVDVVDVSEGPSGPGRPEPQAVGGNGVGAVRRARRVSAAGAGVAGALFLAGALRTATESSTDHLAGGVGLSLSGALLVAVVAGLMVGHLKGLLEQRKLVVLGPWDAVAEATATAATAAATTTTTTGAAAPPAERIWVVEGLSLYHRAGCRALDGRAAGEHARASLAPAARPCGLCEPGPRD